MNVSLLNINPRSRYVRLFIFCAVFTFLLAVYNYSLQSIVRFPLPNLFPGRTRSSCAPEAWNDGQWTYQPRTNLTGMARNEDALEFAGFQGCASDREFFWHLAAEESQWPRWPAVSSYAWKPKNRCDVRPLDGGALLKELVEQGGWLLLGDSITEGHFFSLSCILYPHVRATPNYTENPYFDRAWPQNIYLNPASPLLPTLSLPPGFSVEHTPLVTFRRVDLLLNKTELIDLHRELHPPNPKPGENATELFSDEAFWSLSPTTYMPIFTAPLPEANYATLVVSTGGHWTTTLLHAFRDESKAEEGYGIDGVLVFFKEAMKRWAGDVQRSLDVNRRAGLGASGGRVDRRVVVRAYLPGHEDCHSHKEPWTVWHPFQWNWYNWAQIKDFNRIFQNVLASSAYPDIFYLPIDNPGLLRPDAHASGDCLHIMTGAGVMEGWSHYIWHFVSRELAGRIR